MLVFSDNNYQRVEEYGREEKMLLQKTRDNLICGSLDKLRCTLLIVSPIG